MKRILLWGLILVPLLYYVALIGGSLTYPGYLQRGQTGVRDVPIAALQPLISLVGHCQVLLPPAIADVGGQDAQGAAAPEPARAINSRSFAPSPETPFARRDGGVPGR
ncbi:MAG: hypothetical protein QOJ53_1992 [Sphingomonadales bacterium]|jgi:hypothetical protein|nr:hypothetical protein [Sphingomonadales bacterium]MEA3047660.1 hypothetical protein [Sphingomonadales bacterium]